MPQKRRSVVPSPFEPVVKTIVPIIPPPDLYSSENDRDYVTVNPATLDDPKLWSYRELQELCKRVGLICTGPRHDVYSRLMTWHRGNHDSLSAGQFFNLPVEGDTITPVDTPQKVKQLSSILRSSENISPISPICTPEPLENINKSPFNLCIPEIAVNRQQYVEKREKDELSEKTLLRRAASMCTTSKRQLEDHECITPKKKISKKDNLFTTPKFGSRYACSTDIKKKKTMFSPYAKVRLISPRILG
eukprot:GHVL01029264.1.p1 GENE.GHVL01029264.1~~GHVL01029264.1.p1  ORF type:complete len:278 (+),score=33.51 GHVL01029264.1:95-835(+)